MKLKSKQFKDAFKFGTASITFDVNPRVDAHFVWIDLADISRDEVSGVRTFTDHLTDCDESLFLFYRALMLEAGFVPRYAWVNKNNFLNDFLQFTYNGKHDTDSLISNWKTSKVKWHKVKHAVKSAKKALAK